ncbi:alpha-protein kinase 2 isoform X2 [Lithobates pipiens]
MEGDFNPIGVNDNRPKNDPPPDLEGDSNPIGVNNITPKSNSPLDPFVVLRGLPFLHIEDTSDHSLDDDTNFDTEEDEPTFFTGDTLFILEDVDPDTENCKFVLCPMTPYSADTSLNIEDSSQNINVDLVPNRSLSRRFRCHTSNVDHHYCMWHGSKYCCRTPEPNWDVKETIEKELYDDCLNYLECSDVLTDYANGIWLSALLGNESVFLLETDQDDETKASQNESDVLPSDVTYVNEGSSNTLAMDDLTSLCVSHSKAPAVDEKGDLSGELLKVPETEMVITVGHQQNNTSSPQKKKKCKLPGASAAIQDDQAGIEVENSPEEHRSASMKKRSNGNPFMELYLVTMTDEPGSDPLICDPFEEREQGVEKLILVEDTIDKQCPGIHTEEEVHQLSKGEIQDQFTLESTNFYDSGQSQMQEKQLMEADIVVEHVDINRVCTIESAEEDDTKEDNYIKEDDHIKEDNNTKEDYHTKEDDHTKLIQFLKENIRPTEPPSELKVVENTEQEKGEEVQELEGTQIYPVELKNQDGSPSFEKIGEYIQENYGIENEESPVSGLLVSFKNTEINEVIGNESVIVDHGLESVNGELHTADSKPKILESVSQIVDVTLQVINSDLHLCTNSFDGAIDTKFTENMTDNLDVCKQEYEHEISSINGNEYSQTMDNCAIKTDDLLGQSPRENADSDSQSMENCDLNPDDLTNQPPRENSESDNQTMAKCARNPDDLVDQPPRANDESNDMSMANCTIKTNDLVGIPPRENADSDNQTLDNYAIKIDDLVDQPPRENYESDNQTMHNCAIKIDDLVVQTTRENDESDNQTMHNCAIKTDDLVGQPPRENDESDNQTMDKCVKKMYDLADKPPGENNTMSIPKVSNDTNVCLEPTDGSSSLMVDNSPSTDDNLRTNSVQNVSGKQMKRNASAYQGIGMHSKKKALEKFPLNSFCASISREHHDIINNVVENYQGGNAERHLSCFGGNGEMLSLVKTKDGMCSNSTEIEKAHSLHVKDNIPNSQELSQVCRDPDTIRGAELVRAQSIDLDQSGGTSCSLYFISSPSQCEKGTDSKMVKKKFKSAGKEATKNTENEAKALDVNEGFQPEEEKRLKRQSSIDTAVSKDSKNAPKILHGIQAEMFPDRSGNLKLFCHFGDIHADSTITWTKDSKLLARMHRGPKDNSPVSLAIVQTSKKDQGVYLCTLKNMHGKVTTEFQLTSEVLEQLTRYQDVEGGEEVEFNQLFFREDFISDMYFGGNLHGRIATEDLHFGEGVHRKAFRSTVMCGLLPVFNPGHLCVLKVHNAIAYGTKTNDELVQKNYKLAVQECHVQNTAREYAKIYAAEAEELKEFGTVPEIIPIFLIHRPANNIPYATVEEELIGDFVKYSVKDGKEINFLRRDSEAGQKCCTFQHWVYERTNGNLLVTDLQGVGMKLTDVGIATISKGFDNSVFSIYGHHKVLCCPNATN